MSLLLPFEILAVTDIPPAEDVTEINLNRFGLNSVELPKANARVICGETLKIRFANQGAAVHLNVTTSNAGMFTDFYHQSMYVIDDVILGIPLKKGCVPGFFDIDIVAGYGGSKVTLRVEVIVRPSRGEEIIAKEPPVQPVSHGRPNLLMVALGIGLILYSAWYYTKIEFLNIAAFIVLIVGALYVWYRQT
ncbi:MAG: hypothetical protein WC342_09270 [Methanoregula sp.]|jgi:hypothetical protein